MENTLALGVSTISGWSAEFSEKMPLASSVKESTDVVQGLKNPLCAGYPQRLFEARERTGEHGTAVSRRAGLSENMVRTHEDGASVPALDSVEAIAAVLGVPPAWLAYGHEGNEPFQKRRPRQPLPQDPPFPDERLRLNHRRFESVGKRIAQARLKSGLSMRRLSTAAGISVTTWSNTEAGTTVPKIDSLERMAVALGVAPAWLAYGEEPRE